MSAQIAIMYDASNDDNSIDITIGTSRDNDTGNDVNLSVQAVKLMMAGAKTNRLPKIFRSETVNKKWVPFDICR